MNFCYSNTTGIVEDSCVEGKYKCELKDGGGNYQNFPGFSVYPAKKSAGFRLDDWGVKNTMSLYGSRFKHLGTESQKKIRISGPVAAYFYRKGENKILLLADEHNFEKICPDLKVKPRETLTRFNQLAENEALDVSNFLHLFFRREEARERKVDFFLEAPFPLSSEGRFLPRRKEHSHLSRVFNYFHQEFNKNPSGLSNVRFYYTDLRMNMKSDFPFITWYRDFEKNLRENVGGNRKEEILDYIKLFSLYYGRKFLFNHPLTGEEYEGSCFEHTLNSIIFSLDVVKDFQDIEYYLKSESKINKDKAGDFLEQILFFPSLFSCNKEVDFSPLKSRTRENRYRTVGRCMSRIRKQLMKLEISGEGFDWCETPLYEKIVGFLQEKVLLSVSYGEKIVSNLQEISKRFLEKKIISENLLFTLGENIILSYYFLLEAYYLPRMFIKYEDFDSKTKVIYAGLEHIKLAREFLEKCQEKNEVEKTVLFDATARFSAPNQQGEKRDFVEEKGEESFLNKCHSLNLSTVFSL